MSKAVALKKERLSYSEKFSRLRERLHDPEWRRYFKIILAGKALAILLLLGLIVIGPALFHAVTGSNVFGQASTAPTPAMVADLGDATKNPTINPINTVWTLVAAFLVFCMQAGFTMLEAGFCRSRETVNVLVECVFDTCLCGFLYYTWGYAFMFGQGNGLIGWHDPNDVAGGPVNNWFFLQTRHGHDPVRLQPAFRCWPTGCSSSPSRTVPRPSAPAR